MFGTHSSLVGEVSLLYLPRIECATWLLETQEPDTGRGRFEISRLQVSQTRPEEVYSEVPNKQAGSLCSVFTLKRVLV